MNEIVASPFAERAVATPHDSAGARQSQSRELAETQTKYLMAERFPRDERAAMDRILNAFSRHGLAERSQYQFARGGSDIAGPSIHAAQSIAQGWGNIEFGWRELSRGMGADGKPYSEVEAFAVDLQSRVPSRITFIVPHWRDTKSGGYRLKDERDIYELCASQAQRRKRACILSVVPQDVIDTAMDQASSTLKARADTSPEAMHKMVEAFAQFGVTREHIEKRIQRRLDSIQPAQVVALKRIYASLRDDMSTPSEWFDMGEPAVGPEATASLEKVRAATAAKKPAKTTAAAPAAETTPAKTLAQYRDEIAGATSAETAALALDEARDTLDAAQHAELAAQVRLRWDQPA